MSGIDPDDRLRAKELTRLRAELKVPEKDAPEASGVLRPGGGKKKGKK